jgi:hypothetical protein
MYNELPEEMYSLHEFAEYAKDLDDNAYNLNKHPLEHIRFVLTGEVAGDHQAHVNPLLNELKPRDPISASRDYPCILGITQDIVAVDCPVRVYPISNPEDAITSSIHLDYFVRIHFCLVFGALK